MDQSVARELANAFAKEEVDSMSLDELQSAARESRVSEVCNAAGGIDVEMLLESILLRYDGDSDLARGFMVKNGLDDGEAEKYISDFMS
jgi:hypothetical protein